MLPAVGSVILFSVSLVWVEKDQQRLDRTLDLGAGSVRSLQDGSVWDWDILSFILPSGEASSVFIGVSREQCNVGRNIKMGSGTS